MHDDRSAPQRRIGELVHQLRERRRRSQFELAFFSTIATFGTPLDVALAKLAIEAYFPADTDAALRDGAGDGG